MSSELVTDPVIDAIEFRQACARFATGVAIVAVLDHAGQPHGMTVNSFTSISLNPLLFLVSIDHRAGIFALFHDGAVLSVNVLDEDQRELSTRFARPGEDRFGSVEWTAGVTGAPIIPGALATFEGTVLERIVAGDHTLMLSGVRATRYRHGRPLLYFESRYRQMEENMENNPE